MRSTPVNSKTLGEQVLAFMDDDAIADTIGGAEFYSLVYFIW